MTDAAGRLDPGDARLALRATGLLREFNVAGVLDAADVHVATTPRRARRRDRRGRAAGGRPRRPGAAARPRLRRPRRRAGDGDDRARRAGRPPRPALARRRRVDGSPRGEPARRCDGAGGAARRARPLRLEGTRLYLDRYWRQECSIADGLAARSAAPAAGVDADDVGGRPRPAVRRRRRRPPAAAAAAAVATPLLRRRRRARHRQDDDGRPDRRPPRPAGRGRRPPAAPRRPRRADRQGGGPPRGGRARRGAAHADRRGRPRQRLLGLSAVTLHRLLGWRPGNRSRFRHDRANRLPFDVVIVDETSMVSTSMMAKLVDAVGTDARLVLVGDPDQLASVEAGAVLGDIVGPAADRTRRPRRPSPIGDGIVVLRRVHRFGGAIAELAAAIRRGDVDGALDRARRRPRRRRVDRDRRPPIADDVRVARTRSATGSSTPAAGSPAPPRPATRRAALDALARDARPVRPPPRSVRRRRLDRPDRALARRVDRRLRRRRRLVRRPAAARHGQRLRPAPLQRRHRRHRPQATTGSGRRRVRARRHS